MRFFLILIVIFISSCKLGKKEYVFNYADEKLISVMADLHIAKEFVERQQEEDKDSVGMAVRTYLSQIHDVDMDLVDSDIAELQRSLKKYQSIQMKVEEQLKDKEREKNRSAAKSNEKARNNTDSRK